MPINAHPDFLAAEGEYNGAETKEQKIRALKKMISLCPSHKGAENLRAQLKKRLAKLKYTKEKEIKKTRGGKEGIKKEDMQVVIIGKTNSGKSSLLRLLTNASPEISPIEFATKFPIIGMMPYAGTQIQLIENPAIDSEYYDKGISHTTDTILILVDKLEDIKELLELTKNYPGKKIIAFNKIDLLNENEKRRLEANLKSKRYDFILISAKTSENIEELKEKVFQTFEKIRVFTKEPGKEKSPRPIILNPRATLKNVAEKILKGFSKNIRQTKIWGPSSKFPGQIVGLNHELKDLDVVEFKTR